MVLLQELKSPSGNFGCSLVSTLASKGLSGCPIISHLSFSSSLAAAEEEKEIDAFQHKRASITSLVDGTVVSFQQRNRQEQTQLLRLEGVDG